MQRSARMSLICGVLALVLLPVRAVAADDRAALLALESRYLAAISGDRAGLEEMLADEFVYNTAKGTSLSRAEFIAYLDSGALAVGKASREQTQLRLYADVGVVTGIARVQATFDGEERVVGSRYLHVWVRQHGRWRLAARQVTYLP